MAEVVLVRLAVRHIGFTHDKDIGIAAEGVWVESYGAEVDIRIVTRCLVGG